MSADDADDHTHKDVRVHVSTLDNVRLLDKSEDSTQLDERRIRSRAGLGIQPPYNPDRLASFMELNETHAVAVRKKSRYEVGYGFDLAPVMELEPEDADETQLRLLERFWRSRDSRWQTGPHLSAEPTTPEEVLELSRQDYHSIGWLCLEILTDNMGRPIGLAHVPANTVRVRKPDDDTDDPLDARGYVQERQGRRRYFGEAGDRYRGVVPVITEGDDGPEVRYVADEGDDREPIFVDRETGEVARGSASALTNDPANELIFVRNPSPLSLHYGIPTWISAIRTIAADEAAKDYNREFFANDTIPRMVIKVTGGELSEESKRDLKQMLRNLREESHRTVLLEVEKFQGSLADDIEIELEPLSQGISEEMSFRAFRTKNEHEIAKVHEVPPILIGVTETSNRANSHEQVHEFATEVILPEQHKFAERLYQVLHQQAFGAVDWTLEFKLRGANQPKEEAEVARRRITASQGTMTVNEAREQLGMDALTLPDGDPDPRGDQLLAELGGGGGPAGPGPAAPPGGNGQSEASARHPHAPPPDNKIGERDWSDVERRFDYLDALGPDDLAALDKQPQNPREEVTFDSSNLDQGVFDFLANELFLSFKREGGPNSLYVYVNVPTAEWAGLVTASSHGSYHYANIRMEYAYLEISNFHDRLPEGPVPAPEDVPEGVPSEI